MRADIAEEVGQHLPDPALVDAGDQPRRRLGADRPLGLNRRGVSHSVPHDYRQVRFGEVERGRPVQPGQLKQLGDEGGHALRLLLDPAHRPW